MDKVVVLMSTYNGDRYLENQIESLMGQEGVEVEILARDDGSSDKTLEILEGYKKANSNDEAEKINQSFDYYVGQNLGPAGSFLDIMKHAPEADFYALCDQDDTWLPDKLKIAVEAIKNEIRKRNNERNSCVIEGSSSNKNANKMAADEHLAKNSVHDIPILYYGMPRFADNDGKLLKGPKGIYEKSLDFPSCLIKSNSTGCTMVFNRALLELINSKTPGTITMHDEWLHKVCLAVGGILIYDEDGRILYRQHGGNTIGGQLSPWKVLKRYWKTVTEPDCIRSKCVRSVVDCFGDNMSPENRKMAEKVAFYKESFGKRIELLLDKEIKTEYPKRNVMFKIAVLLGIF